MKIASSHLSLLFLSFLFFSCSDSSDEKRAKAIASANISLSTGDCDSAITTLLEAGVDQTDATFLRTLSIAYACKGNFNVVSFMENDLEKFSQSSITGALGGMTTFSTSADMTTADDADFTNLQIAIDYLLYAGGIASTEEPSVSARAALFNSDEAIEINMQLLYLVMVQLGRYLSYYGNTIDGEKGSGDLQTPPNKCFLNYEDAITNATLFAALGYTVGNGFRCNQTNKSLKGHSDLGPEGDYNIERLCQGVTLLNNFLEIFPAVLENIAGDRFDSIKDVETTINDLKTIAVNFDSNAEAVANVLSQASCEADNTDDTYIQFYFAVFFEKLLL